MTNASKTSTAVSCGVEIREVLEDLYEFFKNNWDAPAEHILSERLFDHVYSSTYNDLVGCTPQSVLDKYIEYNFDCYGDGSDPLEVDTFFDMLEGEIA